MYNALYLYSGIFLLSTKILRKAKVKQFPQLSLTSRPENLQAVKLLGLTRVLYSKENNTQLSLIQTQLLVHRGNNNQQLDDSQI